MEVQNIPRLRRFSLILTGAYAVIAALWIVGSTLTHIASLHQHETQVRVVKDTLFVLVSSVVLYFLTYRAICKIQDSERAFRAERALRQANEHLRAVVYNSPVSIVSLDTAGNVQSWNGAAERLFGWSEIETRGSCDPTVPAEKQEEARLHLQRVLRG